MKNKEFVTYHQAWELRDLGYRKRVGVAFYYHMYYTDCDPMQHESWLDKGHMFPAPLKQQAFRFFRKVRGFISQITYDNFDNSFGYQIDGNSKHYLEDSFLSYEDAEEACLEKLIQLAKQVKEESISETDLFDEQTGMTDWRETQG